MKLKKETITIYDFSILHINIPHRNKKIIRDSNEKIYVKRFAATWTNGKKYLR